MKRNGCAEVALEKIKVALPYDSEFGGKVGEKGGTEAMLKPSRAEGEKGENALIIS